MKQNKKRINYTYNGVDFRYVKYDIPKEDLGKLRAKTKRIEKAINGLYNYFYKTKKIEYYNSIPDKKHETPNCKIEYCIKKLEELKEELKQYEIEK